MTNKASLIFVALLGISSLMRGQATAEPVQPASEIKEDVDPRTADIAITATVHAKAGKVVNSRVIRQATGTRQ